MWRARSADTVDNCDPALSKQAGLLRTALEDVQAMTATLTGYLMSASEDAAQIYKVGLASVRFLLAVGDLLIGWRLLVQANVAHAALAGPTATTRSTAARSRPRRSSPPTCCPTSPACAVWSSPSTTRSCGYPKPRSDLATAVGRGPRPTPKASPMSSSSPGGASLTDESLS